MLTWCTAQPPNCPRLDLLSTHDRPSCWRIVRAPPIRLYWRVRIDPLSTGTPWQQLLTLLRAPTAEAIHSWISRQLPNRPHPAIKRPIDWMRWATILTVLAGAGTLLVTAAPYIMPIVSSRKIWAALTLVAILVLTSGFMFTHIRKVPYVSGDGHGGISYFVAGFQSQLGLETQIIAAICKTCQPMLLHFCGLLLTRPITRRPHVLLRHLPCGQGPPDCGPKVANSRGACLGRSSLPLVQLPAQRLPHQERLIPLLTASVHVSVLNDPTRIGRSTSSVYTCRASRPLLHARGTLGICVYFKRMNVRVEGQVVKKTRAGAGEGA